MATWTLALCVAMQGFGIAMAQTVWPSHYHVAVPTSDHSHDHKAADSRQAPGHSHSDIGHHRHDSGDPSVVLVADDDAHGTDGSNRAAPKRLILDADAVASACAGSVEKPASAPWAAAVPCDYASHIEGPPERPPRHAATSAS